MKIENKSTTSLLWSARRRLTIIESIWNFGNVPYLVANAHGFNFIKIGGIWIFQGEQKTPLGGGGLHLTCDAHFRTRMSYSSQKSCVKIWFGLVEIGGSLYHFFFLVRGAEAPYWGVTYDLWCPFSNLAELFQSKVGLQPEKNKLVFFGKKRFFSRKKHSLKKTGQNFVFFIFKHLFTLYCFLNYKKMANCAYITPRVWVTRQFSTGKKNLLVWKIKTRKSKEN